MYFSCWQCIICKSMSNPTPKVRKKRSEDADYVDNAIFSQEVENYARHVQSQIAAGLDYEAPSNYIGECFLKIANGLSKAPNFSGYSYREDMVMDAVENFLHSGIKNYKIDTPTRTGKPNAFSYFTKIAYYAFLRRIGKEKDQTKIKAAIIENGNLGDFAEFGDDLISSGIVERVKSNSAKFIPRDGFGDAHTSAKSDKIKERFAKARATVKAAKAKPAKKFNGLNQTSTHFDFFSLE